MAQELAYTEALIVVIQFLTIFCGAALIACLIADYIIMPALTWLDIIKPIEENTDE